MLLLGVDENGDPLPGALGDAQADAYRYPELYALLALLLWDAQQAAYQREQRAVERATLITLLESRIASGWNGIDNLIPGLAGGQVGVAAWQEAFFVELRRAHFEMYALGRGGWSNMTAADWLTVDQKLRAEWDFLQQFARQIANGELSAAQIRARMRQYESGIWSSFHKGETQAFIDAGFTEERRVLNPAEHCVDCVGWAAQGWQTIGSLPAPGEQSACGHNCKCNKEYR